MQMEPAYGWPIWVPACLVFLSSCACALGMSKRRWLAALSSCGGVFVAEILGLRFWWPEDPIAAPLVPIVLAVVTSGALLLGTGGAVIGYGLRGNSLVRGRLGPVVLLSIAVISSGAIVGNGLLVTQKIRRNRGIAEQRVRALYQAAEHAVAVYGDEGNAQDSAKVRKYYQGPSFDDQEWQGMTRNFLRRDGFVYQIHIAKPPDQGVLVYALPIEYPARVKEGLCLDLTARMQCPLDVNRGQTCIPCQPQKGNGR